MLCEITANRAQRLLYTNESTKPFYVKDALEAGAKADFQLMMPMGEIEPFRLVVSYLDGRLFSGRKVVEVSGGDQGFKVEEVD